MVWTVNKARSRPRKQAMLGFLLAVIVSLAVVGPVLSQSGPEESADQSIDPGRSLAVAAGCDLTQKDVAMDVGIVEYWDAAGYETIREAVLGIRSMLADDGARFSEDELSAAADQAVGDNPYVVNLQGASIHVRQLPNDRYLAAQIVQCA